jgi:hypothetical protein
MAGRHAHPHGLATAIYETSGLSVIRNFTVKKFSVMQHHSCEAYSYAEEFSLVRKVALI